MSVVGIDVGNANAVIAAARQGGIEVLANDYNYRVTPYVPRMESVVHGTDHAWQVHHVPW